MFIYIKSIIYCESSIVFRTYIQKNYINISERKSPHFKRAFDILMFSVKLLPPYNNNP